MKLCVGVVKASGEPCPMVALASSPDGYCMGHRAKHEAEVVAAVRAQKLSALVLGLPDELRSIGDVRRLAERVIRQAFEGEITWFMASAAARILDLVKDCLELEQEERMDALIREQRLVVVQSPRMLPWSPAVVANGKDAKVV